MVEKSRTSEALPLSVTIRGAKPEDIPTIKKCLIDSWVEHAKAAPELLDEERMKASKVEEYYQKCFDEPNKCFVFIAESEGEFAGFIRADIQEIPLFFKYPTIMYVDDTYILPEHR